MKLGIMWIASSLGRVNKSNWEFIEAYFTKSNLSLPIERLKKGYVIHAPFKEVNIASNDDEERAEAIKVLKKTIDKANQLNSQKLVYHFGVKEGESSLEMARHSIKEIKPYAKEKGINILGENMDNNPGINLIGSNTEEIDRLAEVTDLCLDIGHANTTGNLKELIDNYSDKIKHLHLSDNNGRRDQHLPIGEGNINFKSALEEFRDKNITASFELFDIEESLNSKKKIERILYE